VYGTKQDITKVVRSVYVNQVTWQLTKIVGALDLVGNPISLMASLGTGVKDFFYEPSQGLIQSPMAFGRGVAKGTLSLMSHTTSGALSAVGRITKTVSV
jgi:vacuolar protein sorting-associated protein 13A/C